MRSGFNRVSLIGGFFTDFFFLDWATEHGDNDSNYGEHANKEEMLNVHMACLCCVDVAVGAPYDDEGAGSVYIYHGSSDGLKKEPAQV